MLSTRLHRVFSSDRVVILTLLVPGAVSAFGALTIGSLSIIAIAFDDRARRERRLPRDRRALRAGTAARTRPGHLTGRIPLSTRQRHRRGGRRDRLPRPENRVRRRRRDADSRGRHLRLPAATFVAARGRPLAARARTCGEQALPWVLLAEARRFAEQGDHWSPWWLPRAPFVCSPPVVTARASGAEASGSARETLVASVRPASRNRRRSLDDRHRGRGSTHRRTSRARRRTSRTANSTAVHDDPQIADRLRSNCIVRNRSSPTWRSTSSRTLSPSSTTGAKRSSTPPSATQCCRHRR